ncbi:hypothetical protein PVAND_011184 [Polypedilum vanderplanki]|uniref:YLPM1-like spectrin repeat domain-containing protein n=1 Tax=Polypedilum vanderplanki TaxID=319348 RepID=A0A9J6CIQ3_POLVA|nr:hypothetical protein PVAND_011184 [Polypedilum vanderplanki]
MNRSKERKSRFGPPNMAGNTRISNFAASHQQGSQFKTPEQIAFDKEFQKWEESFEQWKKSFANHPDRNAYRQYENKFLEVRDKLIAKRKQIYNNRSNPNAPTSFPFENQLSAADAMANSILSKFGDSRSSGSGGSRRNDNYGARNDNYNRNDNYSSRNSGGHQSSQMDYRSMERRGGRSFSSGGSGNFNNRDNRNQSRGRGFRDRDNNQNRGRDNRDSRSQNRGSRFDSRNNKRGNDRRSGGSQFERGSARNAIQKPTQAQIEKELSRQDVYPFNKWELLGTVDRPPLVGKRAKKKNRKILRVLEMKRKIANGEIPLEELPFGLRIERLFELAKNAECPNRLPGSSSKKLKTIRAKDPNSLTADERKFQAYAEYVISKRSKYFEKKKVDEDENPAGTERMEVVEASTESAPQN